MRIASCEHPVKVLLPGDTRPVYVPCGKCVMCRLSHAQDWCHRLESERMCHRFCIFFTLTYNDAHLPTIKFENGRVYDSQGAFLFHPRTEIKNWSFKDDSFYCQKRGTIPVVSVSDIQLFVKRLRSYITYYEKDSQKQYLRYFISSEYGPTTFRPHYHGLLFFSSEWFAKNAQSYIRRAWSDDNRDSDSSSKGFIVSRFVEGSNPSSSVYAASYLNCFTDLPAIYRHKSVRPFSLCSRHPPIGSLLVGNEEIRQLFHSGAVEQCIFNRSTSDYEYVPLTGTLKNRLYPKLKAFGSLSHSMRVELYGLLSSATAKEWFCREIFNGNLSPSYLSIIDVTYDEFKEYIRYYIYKSSLRNTEVARYLDWLYSSSIGTDSESALHRYFSIIRRIHFQSVEFEVSLESYVTCIESFYKNFDYHSVRCQMEFEKEYCKDAPVTDLLFLDMYYLSQVRSRYLSDGFFVSDLLILEGYGYDFTKTSDFFAFLWRDVSDTESYRTFKSKMDKMYTDTKKKKAKNEYIELHSDNQLIKQLYG